MKKRITINIILAFIVCALINLVKPYIQIVLLHNNLFFTGSYYDYLKVRVIDLFLLFPLFFLIFILLPYNAIILWYAKHKKKWLLLVQKIILLFLIFIVELVILGTFFVNIWYPSWWLMFKYFIGILIYSLLFAIPIHYLIDIPEQRKMKEKDKQANYKIKIKFSINLEMKKRIGINIVLAIIICSLSNLIIPYIQIAILHNNNYFKGSYYDFIQGVTLPLFLLFPLLFLIFVLLPYNWIILLYLKYKKRWLPLTQKIAILFVINLISFLLLGTFENIWPPHWSGYLRYFIWFSIYSLLFAIPIHYLVDVPEQKKMEEPNKKANKKI